MDGEVEFDTQMYGGLALTDDELATLQADARRWGVGQPTVHSDVNEETGETGWWLLGTAIAPQNRWAHKWMRSTRLQADDQQARRRPGPVYR